MSALYPRLFGGLKKGRAFFVIEEKASAPFVEEA